MGRTRSPRIPFIRLWMTAPGYIYYTTLGPDRCGMWGCPPRSPIDYRTTTRNTRIIGTSIIRIGRPPTSEKRDYSTSTAARTNSTTTNTHPGHTNESGVPCATSTNKLPKKTVCRGLVLGGPKLTLSQSARRFMSPTCQYSHWLRALSVVDSDVIAGGSHGTLIPLSPLLHGMTSFNSRPEQPPPQKAMLHCPSCTHSNRINGDWTIDIHDDYTVYECPNCGTVIDTRRNQTQLTTHSNGALQFKQ